MEKLPWLKFFPGDWLADEKLRLCSLPARGLWIDLLCVMHKSEPRGMLQQSSGKPFTADQIARIAGCTKAEADQLLRELIEAGVASKNGAGVVFSRRIVRDESLREARSKAGSKGGKVTGD